MWTIVKKFKYKKNDRNGEQLRKSCKKKVNKVEKKNGEKQWKNVKKKNVFKKNLKDGGKS